MMSPSGSPQPAQPHVVSWSQSRFSRDGLRTRFRPSRPIRMLFLVFVPWTDAVLLVLWTLFAVPRSVVTPGSTTLLPALPETQSVHADLLLVANPGDDGHPGARVFFDDLPYDMADADARTALGNAVRTRSMLFGDSANVVLFVDAGLSFGDLADLLAVLRNAGVPHVHFASRTAPTQER